jgi:hypothetical protein
MPKYSTISSVSKHPKTKLLFHNIFRIKLDFASLASVSPASKKLPQFWFECLTKISLYGASLALGGLSE